MSVSQSASQCYIPNPEDDNDDNDGDANGYVGNPGVHENNDIDKAVNDDDNDNSDDLDGNQGVNDPACC